MKAKPAKKKSAKQPYKPTPGAASLRWNGRDRNSLYANATREQKIEIKRRMAQAKEDERNFDFWAYSGFVSFGSNQQRVRNDLGDRA
jgi:hypothetical protein